MQGVNAAALQKLSPCDVQRLQKCLADNQGDSKKCLAEIEAFQKACGKAGKQQQGQQQPQGEQQSQPKSTFAQQ